LLEQGPPPAIPAGVEDDFQEKLMRSKVKAATWFLVGLVVVGSMALPGCGGGSDGSGPPQFLTMSNTMYFGARTGGTSNLGTFTSLPVNGVPVPPGGAVTVGASVFTQSATGTQDFVELTFSGLVDANTVLTGPGGIAGVVLYFVTQTGGVPISTPVPLSLDSQGTIEASNTFPAAGVAPATLRLYYNPDGNLATADFLPTGNYVLTVNGSLRGAQGGPFCSGSGSPSCINSWLPQVPFSIGATTNPLVMQGGNASVPVIGESAAPLNSEIVLNFAAAVDFVSLVGPGNVTTLDPFISLPRTLQLQIDCNDPNFPAGPATIAMIPTFGAVMGNLFVNIVRPIDPVSLAVQPLPANLSFVAYMPEPYLNPTQVRIRFVDGTNLVGTTNAAAGQYQNYSSGVSSLPITSQNPATPGVLLSRPALFAVPGSLPNYNPSLYTADTQAMVVDVVALSGTSTFPVPPFPPVPAAGASCYTVQGLGVVDRQGNQLTMPGTNPDFWLRFAYAPGPRLARNPQPPDATFVGRQTLHGLATLNTANSTTNAGGANTQVPVTYGAQPTGLMGMGLNPLSNVNVLGTPTDMEVGHFVLTQTVPLQANNNMTNPGRGSVTTPGVPDSQYGTTPSSLLNIVAGPYPSPAQPWGNFLYVVDSDSQSLKVFNGYNFQLLSTMTGIGAPGGLGISPDLNFLYVTNENQGTVQRIFANPAVPQFHTIAGTITGLGAGPRAVSVMPANEDVFVLNYAGNSFSIIDTATQVVRVTLSGAGAIGPSECAVTGRMLGLGLTNAYTAYILNAFSNSVTCYESDSPSVPENGPNGLVKGTVTGFNLPKRGSWNWLSYIGTTNGPGVFVANTGGTTVEQLCLTNFTLGPQPNFPGPPGTRTYLRATTLSASTQQSIGTAPPSDVTVDNHSGLYNVNTAGITNNKSACDPNVGGGVPSIVLVSYPSVGRVASFSYSIGGTLLSTTQVPGCDFLQSYYDQ
jgi:hypothetical protein